MIKNVVKTSEKPLAEFRYKNYNVVVNNPTTLEIISVAYIALSKPKSNGAVYATVVESIRDGGRVYQNRIENLGRVIDQENGVFQNRKRGLFRYTLEKGFLEADSSQYTASKTAAFVSPEPERLILDFGDSYILDQYVRNIPIFDAFMEVMPNEQDSLFALLFYRILTARKAYYYAQTWWIGNYVRILFPTAELSSQRISEFLVRLGTEEVQRRFFGRYLDILYGHSGNSGAAILIDSSGLPNASGMSITQLNNHNGDISLEIRLIYVLDRRSGMPIYFRYCPGNIVDVSTLCTTIAELSQYNVSIDYAIVDAGYFSEGNVKEMYRNSIRFVTRLSSNRKIYKEVTEECMGDILSARYAVRYGKRLVYMKKTKIDVFGHAGYAYVGVDVDSRNSQMKRTMFNSMDDKVSAEDIDQRIAMLGMFVIISSEDMDTTEILPLYYTRQQVEQVFDIAKNSADTLPLRVQSEETFRGHLMLTFLATALLQMLQREIMTKKKRGDKINPEGAFIKLRNQKCKVFATQVIPQEPVKDINDVYKLLNITCPTIIQRNDMM